MSELLLRTFLWFVALIRAAIVAGGTLLIYIAIYTLYFNGKFSKPEEILLPYIGAGILFLGLLLSSTSWVENNVNSDNNETKKH